MLRVSDEREKRKKKKRNARKEKEKDGEEASRTLRRGFSKRAGGFAARKTCIVPISGTTNVPIDMENNLSRSETRFQRRPSPAITISVTVLHRESRRFDASRAANTLFRVFEATVQRSLAVPSGRMDFYSRTTVRQCVRSLLRR